MQTNELPPRDQLKGTLYLLAWVTLAVILRDWHRVSDYLAANDAPAIRLSQGAHSGPPEALR